MLLRGAMKLSVSEQGFLGDREDCLGAVGRVCIAGRALDMENSRLRNGESPVDAAPGRLSPIAFVLVPHATFGP